MPRAHRDDAADFRAEMMTHSAVKAVIDQDRTRLEGWFNKIPLDKTGKLTQPQWIAWLKSLTSVPPAPTRCHTF
eukprot:6050614-Prymnesium_polylepis.1